MPQVRHRRFARTVSVTAICTALSATALGTSTESVVAKSSPLAAGAPARNVPAAGRESDARVRDRYVKLPMRFEPNAGRADRSIDFVARGVGYAVYVSSTRAIVSVDGGRVSMELSGARPRVQPTPHGRLAGRTNHVQGNDRTTWRMGLPAYERVEYADVYPGVDLVYYGNQQQLEYDFVVAPGASHGAIDLAFSGQTALSIDDAGQLVIATTRGAVVQRAPHVYQEDADGSHQPVDGGYVIREDGHVGFRVGSYDARRPLVIDPVLGYSTYLGGSGGDDAAGIAVDGAGDVYITGRTGSLDFPQQNQTQASHGGGYYDAYVLKLNASGDSLVYATYLGGTREDYGADIHVDAQGNAFVVGTTYSPDFPRLGGYQQALVGYSDIFLTRLDASGHPVYSVLLGGTDQEVAAGLTVDGVGRAYVTGWTTSPDFPTRNPLQSRLGGSVALKTTNGGATWTSSAAGLNATWIRAIAIDPQNTDTVYAATHGYGAFKSADAGASWVAVNNGLTDPYVSALMWTASVPAVLYAGTESGLYRSEDAGASWQAVPGVYGRVVALAGDRTSPSTLYAAMEPATGGAGVFKSTDAGETWTDVGPYEPLTSIAVSAASPSTIYVGTWRGVFRSTIGGGDWALMGEEFMLGSVHGVAVDPTDASIVYAATDSGLFRSATGGAEWTLVGNFGQVISVVLAPSAPSVVYAGTGTGVVVSHDGGDSWGGAGLGDAVPWTLTVDPANPDVVYAGSTSSIDGVLARFSADGATLEFSTYFGGSSFEQISDAQVGVDGSVYLVGQTASPDLPVTNALQATFGGVRDLFVAKLSPALQVVYSTYLGGSSWEYGTTFGVDASGSVYVAGETYSHDFPGVNGHQPGFGGGYVDGFVAKLAPGGTSLDFSTFLGGSGSENDVTLALAPSGDIVVSGTTGSMDFPTLQPVQATHAGGYIDMFVAGLSNSGTLQFSTYLGGDHWDYNRRVAVGNDGRVWVTGESESTNFPTRDPLQSSKSAYNDVVIARLDPAVADTTPPGSVLRAFGDQGPAGWYVTPVRIEIDASDDRSGVAGIEYRLDDGPWTAYSTPFFIATSGTTRVRTRATDVAGNVESTGADASFKVDIDGPAITIAAPESRTYLHSDVLTIRFSVVDSASGLAGAPVAGLDRTLVSNGQAVSLLALPLGSHHVSVSARDLAGNGNKQSVSFEIVATIDSLIAAVNALASSRAIDANVAGPMLGKLQDARDALARGNVTGGRKKLEDFISYVSLRTGRGVTAEAAELLIGDARYVLGTL